MSEIKVGDYVRIKNGPIRKIITINEGKEKTIFGKYRLDKDYNNCRSVAEKKIIKHSPNIIDLIEVGDYVNGWKVLSIVPTLDKLNEIGFKFQGFDNLLYDIDIKTILTKEQYENNCYKVEE